MFRILSESIKKHPWAIIITLLVISGSLGIGISQLRGEISYYSILPSDYQSVKSINELNKRLGGASFETVLIRAPRVTDTKITKFLFSLEEKLRKDPRFNKGQIQMVPGLKGENVPLILRDPVPVVMSYLTPFIANIKNGLAQTGLYIPLSNLDDEMVKSFAGKDLKSLIEEDYLSNPKVKESIIGKNGFITSDYKAMIIMLKVGAALTDYQQVKLANDLESFVKSELAGIPNVKVNIAGDPTVARDFDRHIRNKTIMLFLISLILVTAILFGSFRRFSDTLIPLFFMLLSLVCTLGIMGWTKMPYSIASVAMLPLLLGTSLTFVVPFVARYYEGMEHYFRSVDSVSTALTTVGAGILLAAVTNVFGFFVFRFSSLPPLKEFGVSCAIGTILTFIFSITLLPAIMVIRDRRYEKIQKDEKEKRSTHFDGLSRRKKRGIFTRAADRSIESLGSLSVMHSTGVIVVFGVLILIGFAQIRTLKTDSDLRRLVPRNLPSISSDYLIEKYFGGKQRDFIIVRGDILAPESLRAIDTAETWIERNALNVYRGEKIYPSRGVNSIATVLKSFNEGVLPQTKENAEALIKTAEANGTFVTGTLISNDRRFSIISLNGIGAIVPEVVDRKMQIMRTTGSKYLKSAGLEYALGGITPLTKDLTKNIIPTEIISSVISLLLCAIALIALFKSFAYGLITLTVAFAGVAAELGFLSIMGWSIDVITSLASALVIGVGVNFGILFTHRYIHEIGGGEQNPVEAIRTTMMNLGRANIVAALASVAAFLVIMLSDIVPLKRFGGVTAFAIGGCIISSLTLMPALLLKLTGHKTPLVEEATPEMEGYPNKA